MLDFQEYFVKRRTEGHAWETIYDGAESSKPAPGVIEAICESSGVILTPSNPLVSVGPMLSVPGVKDALRETSAKVAAVSPIVGGKTLKGPADRMLRDQGFEASALGVATMYKDFVNVMVIDKVDAATGAGDRGAGDGVRGNGYDNGSMEKKSAWRAR